MHGWNDFYIAVAGASAALTGLIFVGISISLKKILDFPTLPRRAFVSLTLLLSILIVSILFLVPRESLHLAGYEILILGVILWIIVTRIDFKNYKEVESGYKRTYLVILFLDQFAILPYIIGGLVILSIGNMGLYWIVPAIIFSFIKSISDAWVLLVEINR